MLQSWDTDWDKKKRKEKEEKKNCRGKKERQRQTRKSGGRMRILRLLSSQTASWPSHLQVSRGLTKKKSGGTLFSQNRRKKCPRMDADLKLEFWMRDGKINLRLSFVAARVQRHNSSVLYWGNRIYLGLQRCRSSHSFRARIGCVYNFKCNIKFVLSWCDI